MEATARVKEAISILEKQDKDTIAQAHAEAIQGVYQEAVDEVLGVSAPEGPQTRDELWDAIHTLTGYAIPRVAVCENHVAPFTTFADLYFGVTESGKPVPDVLWIGNRGGGKTTNSGFLHGAKGRWNEGYSTAIVGATQLQSERGYAEFQRFCGKVEDEIVKSLKKKTIWLWKSTTEIMAGTKKAVNGPHPHLAQFDEVELTEPDVYDEWLNMSQGDEDYPGQNLLTSTRKYPYGNVQLIVDGVEDDLKNGLIPSYRVDIFCVWETIQNQPECGISCGCDKVTKGQFVDPRTGDRRIRSLKEVCGGRAKKSEGFVPLQDVQRRFRQLSRRVWEAQQECSKAGVEGLVHAWYDDIHKLPFWYPYEEYGSIYRSWDWGGTNPHSVHWAQLVKKPLLLKGTLNGEKYERKIHVGQLVTFDEIYHDGGGFSDLAMEVMEREKKWADHGFELPIAQDICDPAGATAKVEVTKAMAEAGYVTPNWRNYPCPVEDSVEVHIEWGEDNNLLVVVPYCDKLDWEYGRYHWPERKPDKPPPKRPMEVDDHAMDEQRYLIWYLYKIGLRSKPASIPGSEFTKKGKHPISREMEKNERRKKTARMPTAPGGSSAAPDYSGKSPYVDEPTVRRIDTPTVKR